MDIDKIRYHFELHLETHYPALSLNMKTTSFLAHFDERSRDAGNEYAELGVQLMWMMYLSGALAQEKNMSVSLPALRDKPDGFYDAGYNEGVTDCRKYLNSAGIKIRT